MRFVSSKKFRAELSAMCLAAEREEILIDRPGGRMLRLSVVNESDALELEKYLGRPEPFIEKAAAGHDEAQGTLFATEEGRDPKKKKNG